MTRQEVSRVLELIRAHYWQRMKEQENDRALQLETWTIALSEASTPDIESALKWWFQRQQWPPQASELIDKANDLRRSARIAQENLAVITGDDRPEPQKYMSPEKYAEFRAWLANMRSTHVGIRRMPGVSDGLD